jgi:alanyl-tRNA synthetase
VGLCKIIRDELVASGVRRVSALTGPKALARIRETEGILDELVAQLKTPQPEDLPKRVASLLEELRQVKRELARQASQSVAGTIAELIAAAEKVGGVTIVAHHAGDVDREAHRQFIDQIRAKAAPAAIVIGSVAEGKVALTAAISRELIERGLSAVDCVRAAAKVAGGGGGGRPDMAEAGGKFPDKLDAALAAGAAYYREKLDAV